MDEEELNRLLREWEAPAAPGDLRPRPARPPLWRWLLTGSIRVPVPAALAVVLVVPFFWTGGAWPVPSGLWEPTPGDTTGPAPSGVEAPAPARRSGELARHALTGPLEGFDAVVTELNFTPGRPSREHRHPGFVLGYVIDGEVQTAINHAAREVVPAGGTFFEPLGALHTTFGSASPDAPARAVVFLVVPNGSPLTERREP